MTKEAIAVEVVPSTLGLERATPSRPEPREVPSLFDDLVHRMPEKMPPAPAPPSVDEVSPRPDVEVLTAEEVRHHEQRTPAPPPEAILETSPTVKDSLVQHVEVNCEALLGFLVALSRIASVDAPNVLSSVKLTYQPGEHPKLYAEAANAAMWALVRLDAGGGREEFSVVLPLQRAINILKYLRGECERVLIGLDHEQIHLGPLSLPHGGPVGDFTPRPSLHTVEARAVLPAFYLEEVATRLTPVLGDALGRAGSSGIHIDFSQQVAVASNGERYNILRMPRMGVESRLVRVSPPAVTVAPEFFTYLMAVVDREWTGVQINATQIAAVGEDYAIVARCSMGNYEGWRENVRSYPGHWVVDKTALQEKLQEAMSFDGQATLRLRFDANQDMGSLNCYVDTGESYHGKITARRDTGAPPVVSARVGLYELVEAVDACRGGLIRLGFEDAKGANTQAVTVQGEDNDFIAIIPPRK